MKLKYIFLFILGMGFFVPIFSQNEQPTAIRVSALNGSSGIGMARLFENPPVIDGKKVQFETAASPDILLPRLLKGEIDIGILPPNVAAKVNTVNNRALVVGAIVGNGMISLITKDTSIKSLADLAGKTVTVAVQGATPEYVFRFLLKNAGLSERVQLDFSIPAAEIPAALIAGKIQYAVVPEPFSTITIQRDSSVKRALDIQKLWATVAGNSPNFPMTAVVIRKDFAQKYPNAVRAFLAEYKKSIAWTNENPAAAGALTQKFLLGLNAPIAAAAIPNCAFVFTDAQNARPSVERLLNVFLQFAPTAIGGKLPDSEFYFK